MNKLRILLTLSIGIVLSASTAFAMQLNEQTVKRVTYGTSKKDLSPEQKGWLSGLESLLFQIRSKQEIIKDFDKKSSVKCVQVSLRNGQLTYCGKTVCHKKDIQALKTELQQLYAELRQTINNARSFGLRVDYKCVDSDTVLKINKEKIGKPKSDFGCCCVLIDCCCFLSNVLYCCQGEEDLV